MELDQEAIRALLAELPSSLEPLRAALVLEGGASPRPWLPPVPADLESHFELWSEVVDAVAPFVTASDQAFSLAALRVLACCPIEASGHAAAPLLGADDPVLPLLAQDAVARSGLPEAGRQLEDLLGHHFGLVRFRAAGNLGLAADPQRIPALRGLFDSPDEEPLVLRWAAVSLGDLGGAEERAFLEAQASAASDPLVRDGIRGGLLRLGAADRPDLHPLPEFVQAVQRAGKGNEEAIDWLLDRYEDRRLGVAVQLAWHSLPDPVVASLISRLTDRSPERRFVAADILGWRGVSDAIPALQALEDDLDVAVCLAASTSLSRLGAPTGLQRYWLERFPPLDRLEARRALALCPPLPLDIVRHLLFEPCGLLPRIGGELVRRDGGTEAQALLDDALQLEWRRIPGDAEPRPDAENDRFVLSRSRRKRLLKEWAPIRALLPAGLQDAALALEEEEMQDPHVIAARGLLYGLRGREPRDAAPHLRPWLASRSALLRFDALVLWVAAHRSLPAPMDQDPHPTVRALWGELARPA